MVIIEGVDAAGVAFAAYFEDSSHHIQSVFEFAFVFEQGQQGGQFFAGEEELFADMFDAAASYSDEFTVSRDGEASSFSQGLRANGNGVRQTVAGFIT